MEKLYTITEAAKILSRTVKCLQQWDRAGILKSKRTPTNRRYYTEQMINSFLKNK